MAIELKKEKVEREPTLEDYWKEFISSARAVRAAWRKIQESRVELPIEGADELGPFAKRCITNYRRQKFENMFPDFVKYVVTCGGFNNIEN